MLLRFAHIFLTILSGDEILVTVCVEDAAGQGHIVRIAIRLAGICSGRDTCINPVVSKIPLELRCQGRWGSMDTRRKA